MRSAVLDSSLELLPQLDSLHLFSNFNCNCYGMVGFERLPKSLPPEIWSQILDYIPRFESRYLLSVCSQFHDNIIRQLFSSIKIYFIGGDKGKKMLNTFYEDFTRETAEKLMRKSWEILNRISRDPQFAKVVKNITIVAYAEGLGIFERCKFLHIHLITYFSLLNSVRGKCFSIPPKPPYIPLGRLSSCV